MARFVDHVLMLAEGGSMSDFMSSTEWISLHPLKDDTSEEQEPFEPEIVKTPTTRPMKKPKEQDPHEMIKRKTGDVTVWSYYAKSAGIWPILLLIIFTAVATTANGFPR